MSDSKVEILGPGSNSLRGVTLSDWQIAGFLARHPVVAARVTYHALNQHAYCDPGWWRLGTEWERRTFGIPVYGISVDDTVFDRVFIFPDADCDLHYSGVTGSYGGSSADDIGEQTNKPPYVPPPHDRGPFDDLATAAVWLGVGLVAITLVRGRM
jgi:hypothetical protein